VFVWRGVDSGEFGANSETGVVDKEVNRLLGAGQPLGDRDHLSAYRQICGDCFHADRMALLQLDCHLRKPVGVARHQYQVIPARRQRPCEGCADA
jgi:hypothetical protein